MKLLDRYILKELISPFLFGIAAFTFILAGSTVLFPLIGEASRYQISNIHIIQLFIYKLPNIIVFTFPMSMLLATLLLFGRFGNDLEIIAFRAGGIGFHRLFIPVIIIGFLVSLMTIWFNEAIVPTASHSAENLILSYQKKTEPTIKKNINLTEYKDGLPRRIINVLEIDAGLMKNVTVAEFDDGELARIIRSSSGKWHKKGGWEFYNGVMHTFPKSEQKKVYVIEFEKEFINIKVNPLDLTKREKKFEEMTAEELWKKIQLQKHLGKDYITDLVNLHMKFSVPFASLIFSILGASVGLRPHRSSSAMGLGLSLVIIMIYYILLSVGMGLGISHKVPPLIAAWLPNIIVGFVGIYRLQRLTNN